MQFAKDSFYAALRDRLSQYDPKRVITINSVQRPAVLVAENAPTTAAPVPLDCFVLTWTAPAIVQAVGPNQALWRVECTVAYSTSGADAANSDRGRSLAALDQCLAAIAQPRNTGKRNYSVTPALDLGTNVFWSDPRFGGTTATSSALSRAAQFTVFFFSEVTA